MNKRIDNSIKQYVWELLCESHTKFIWEARCPIHERNLFRGVMKNLTYYTLSLSGGKDSLALFLKALESGLKINEVVSVDLGDEFDAIYDVLLYVASICLRENIKFTVLTIPETEEYKKFLELSKQKITMFEFLVFFHKKENGKCGYGWCGKQRWGTSLKKQLLNNYYQSLEKFVIEYVGIAADETHRIDIEPHKNYAKSYPLVKWKMTEKDCLDYCHAHNVYWMEKNIPLYSILDRVSCKHCQNKNLKELRNIKKHLKDLWKEFQEWQLLIPYPYRSDGNSVQDLDRRFENENQQINMFDYMSWRESDIYALSE